jgi:hypothetical protein
MTVAIRTFDGDAANAISTSPRYRDLHRDAQETRLLTGSSESILIPSEIWYGRDNTYGLFEVSDFLDAGSPHVL